MLGLSIFASRRGFSNFLSSPLGHRVSRKQDSRGQTRTLSRTSETAFRELGSSSLVKWAVAVLYGAVILSRPCKEETVRFRSDLKKPRRLRLLQVILATSWLRRHLQLWNNLVPLEWKSFEALRGIWLAVHTKALCLQLSLPLIFVRWAFCDCDLLLRDRDTHRSISLFQVALEQHSFLHCTGLCMHFLQVEHMFSGCNIHIHFIFCNEASFGFAFVCNGEVDFSVRSKKLTRL